MLWRFVQFLHWQNSKIQKELNLIIWSRNQYCHHLAHSAQSGDYMITHDQPYMTLIPIQSSSSLWLSLEVEDDCFHQFQSFCLWTLRWLISPILALKVLWHCEHVIPAGRSECSLLFFHLPYHSFVLQNCTAIGFEACCPFISQCMPQRSLFLALDSQESISMLQFLMFAFRESWYQFLYPPLLRLPSFNSFKQNG